MYEACQHSKSRDWGIIVLSTEWFSNLEAILEGLSIKQTRKTTLRCSEQNAYASIHTPHWAENSSVNSAQDVTDLAHDKCLLPTSTKAAEFTDYELGWMG